MSSGDRRLTVDSMLAEAERIQQETLSRHIGIPGLLTPAINSLLQLPSKACPSPEVDHFEGWAFSAYVNSGQNFTATYRLLLSGFYPEALTLLRGISETLVQIAYFSRRREKAERHFAIEQVESPVDGGHPTLRRRRTTQFAQMFRDVSPGFYESAYMLASEFAHGGYGASAHRFVGGPKLSLRAGLFYDSRSAGVVVNQATALVLGFLNWFPHAFPHSNDIEPLVGGAKCDLVRSLDASWAEFPEQRDSLRSLSGLALWVPQEGA